MKEKRDVCQFFKSPSCKLVRQMEEARHYGKVVDIHFPYVSPNVSGQKVKEIAERYVEQIMNLRPKCVLCQGGILCVLPCDHCIKKERDYRSSGM